MFQIPRRIPGEGGGEQNSRVNLALRAGLILSNPETARTDARSLSSCELNTADMLRGGRATIL